MEPSQSPQDKLDQLLRDGAIDQAEYERLSQSMGANPEPPMPPESQAHYASTVPWQIWVIIAALSLEGLLSNLPAIAKTPVAAIWFGAKCLFVLGLYKGWRPVYVICLFFVGLHVVAFAAAEYFVTAAINLALVLLLLSAIRFYFPKTTPEKERLNASPTR